MTGHERKPSVMRTLGLTLGDLWSVLKSGKPRPTTREATRTTTETQTRDTPQGKVTLRRTTVEEIRIEPPPDQAP